MSAPELCLTKETVMCKGLVLCFAGYCTYCGGSGWLAYIIYHGGRAVNYGYGWAGDGEGMSGHLAAYLGLIAGLSALSELDIAGAVEIVTNDDLIIAQLTGMKRCRSEHLLPSYEIACLRLSCLDRDFSWRLDPDNREARRLAKWACDNDGGMPPRQSVFGPI
jgi:ribonuclease HI